MNDEQANSDPLPYTQVDRAVKPKATLLAAMIKSTTQHALGSLVEFWDLNGDPRELEKLVAAGKRSIVLDGQEVRRRFRLASGSDVDPDDLSSLGLLERTADGYRVRGMSRYFAPVERRIQARLAASAGGKASAEARKAASGTAQPRSVVGSEPVREPLKRAPKRSRSDAEATPEATPKRKATQRSAVSGQLQLQDKTTGPPEPADPEKTPSKIDWDIYRSLVGQLKALQPTFTDADGAALKALLRRNERPEEILIRFKRGLTADRYSPKCATVMQLFQRWPELGIVRSSTPERARDEETVFTEGRVY